MKLLHIDSSSLGQASVSRQLSEAVTRAWQNRHPELEVTYRDLVAERQPHWAPGDALSREPGELGQVLLNEFLSADVVVIGAPMYNFGVPSQLKAWIDHLAVPGKTFRYTENGPEGLAGGKTVVIASSRGGRYTQGPAAAMDHQEAYLRSVFGFMGVTDLRFVRAEGVAMGEDQRNSAINHAVSAIEALMAA
ncbi:NAD(P)H-dependent oxidoreductase [Oleiagrimonas sp. C23AA]|uniref:FMN-dependent NADH-azoreductase n=1 Tax=Oleiagrimonas sp. C23AA TaxID=2719047 RepID=UPI00141F7200|nr:NAD(P)H-dependent oxidoreductase [Oleiagrimonas sp. C23AA]NII11148.1 FMN-dependent NADH-azoreductase [Oleiagrimonas sp. C23AA]